MFTSTSLQIGDLTTKQMSTVASNLLTLNISYTMDMASQLSFTIIDPGFEMASNNYFIIGRDVVYESTAISKIKIADSPETTGTPIINRLRHIYEIASRKISINHRSLKRYWQRHCFKVCRARCQCGFYLSFIR